MVIYIACALRKKMSFEYCLKKVHEIETTQKRSKVSAILYNLAIIIYLRLKWNLLSGAPPGL